MKSRDEHSESVGVRCWGLVIGAMLMMMMPLAKNNEKNQRFLVPCEDDTQKYTQKAQKAQNDTPRITTACAGSSCVRASWYIRHAYRDVCNVHIMWSCIYICGHVSCLLYCPPNWCVYARVCVVYMWVVAHTKTLKWPCTRIPYSYYYVLLLLIHVFIYVIHLFTVVHKWMMTMMSTAIY